MLIGLNEKGAKKWMTQFVGLFVVYIEKHIAIVLIYFIDRDFISKVFSVSDMYRSQIV
jgi:hypothetical protein